MICCANPKQMKETFATAMARPPRPAVRAVSASAAGAGETATGAGSPCASGAGERRSMSIAGEVCGADGMGPRLHRISEPGGQPRRVRARQRPHRGLAFSAADEDDREDTEEE